MSVVYVTKPGVKLHLEQNHLLALGKDFRQTIFTFNLERLILVGKVEITHAALSHLFKNHISITYLTRQGAFLGSLTGPEPKNVFLRLKQYEKQKDEAFRLNIAKKFVVGKIRNMRTLILRLGRTLKYDQFEKIARELEKSIKKAESASDFQILLGIEGNATRSYFQGYKLAFSKELGFRRRIRRPPTDPVNACLSFGYTILMNIVHGAVCASRLDPALGNLHELSYGRNSLSLDLMEEFRTPIVDMTVLTCFNLGILKKDDFIWQDPSKDSISNNKESWVEEVDIILKSDQVLEPKPGDKEEDGQTEEPKKAVSVFLAPKAKKKFISRLEKRLSTNMYYEPINRSIPLRQVIQKQSEHYASVIKDEFAEYTPISPR